MTEDRDQPGLGPWEGAWPDDDRLDPELLAHGDRRNVVDRYRYWTVEAIVADLDTRRHPLHVAIENWQHDANIGSIVRTANAFNVAAVHVVGKRRWNRRGAMVTDRYQHVAHHPDVADLAAWARADGLPLVGIDNLPEARPIETAELPREAVMLFGQEGPGLTREALDACDAHYAIAQYGSTRSINAGAAAAIAMHAWVRQHADLAAGHEPGDRRSRASAVVIAATDPETPDARTALRAYYDELAVRFDDGFDPGDEHLAAFRPPGGTMLLAVADGKPVACGCVQALGDGVAEVKRMWVHGNWRGVGLGGRMLRALEQAAADLGHRVVRLDTNRSLTDAVAMYERAGYVAIERYNDNPYAHHWFEKPLSSTREHS